jgi:hypothetical protein
VRKTIVDEWSPVTKDMGLIEAPPARVADEYLNWHRSLGRQFYVQSVASFLASLERLPPLSAEKRRALFVPTNSAWTAFFQSGIDGSDHFPAMSFLAGRLGVRAMRVCRSPPNAVWTGVVWEVYAPPDQGGVLPLLYRRSVAAVNDGGRWTFDQSGSPFPFEHLERYDLRRKRDRFDGELLEQYLGEFGLKPFEDGFYAPSEQNPAILVERVTRWENPPKEYSVAEVVAGIPWDRACPTGR